ncbi:NACHT domain-containing protein [Thermosporothrix hazakensis]|jgi:GTPase SAR1 family protein|uniref:NACHT domain-containing protein n=2 Tax=Thermosporothrix TaxID=768650 RepID=A0A326UNR8_THEHA|nr:NACHT domain-containing protein [Thermosporothrix hazakensis]PZW31942.1 NACHT domain-containing protein [Thermosporothrix hazakensis]BBH91587.1 hypothetical protein KTC_63380 [Thermosporothrix sp. COM3]GCE49733.1 hypothetical protein KTH_46020 [Thermosporothrix hazakensis]
MEEKAWSKKKRHPNLQLKMERERRFWTLEDVATRISNLPDFGPGEPDPRTVGRWERGVSFPSPRYCRALCTIFEKEADELGLIPPSVEAKGTKPLGQAATPNQTDAPESATTQSALSPDTAIPETPDLVEDQQTESTIAPQVLHEEPDPKNRLHLLKRVRSFWIVGVLEHSLHNTPHLALRLKTRPDAIDNPWQHVIQECAQPSRLLPAGTSILHLYDDADGSLLLLGEPGAGKTTLLLELASHLLDRAERDASFPAPVVFHLSSWNNRHTTLTAWLITELHEKYQVPRHLGQQWIEHGHILLLLDGLDEVAGPHRAGCIEAINAYQREHGMVPIVVCSRLHEYFALPVRLQLRSAIHVQPLSLEQIDEYLAKAGPNLEAARTALSNDPMLREIMASPLMLSILTLAYQETPLPELDQKNSLEAHRTHIFSAYVQRMLERRSLDTRYPTSRTIYWLAQLARHMKEHNQTIFYIETLQPDWLQNSKWQHIYTFLATRLIGALIGIFVSIIINLLLFTDTPIDILIDACAGGLLGSLISGSTYQTLRKRLPYFLHRFIPASDPGKRRGLVKGSVWLLLLYACSCFVFYLVTTFLGLGFFLHYPLSSMPPHILNFTLTTLLLSIQLPGLGETIRPTEIIRWSRQAFTTRLLNRTHGKNALLISALTTLIIALTFGFMPRPLLDCLAQGTAVGLSLGLNYWLLLAVFQGLSSNTLSEEHRATPNQGIHCSIRNSLIVCLVSVITVAPVYMFSSVLAHLLYTRTLTSHELFLLLPYSIAQGLAIGILAGLLNGGLACIQHGILRAILTRRGIIPAHFPHFLEYAAERVLLRKVGGGYIFIHRLLLEYFAGLPKNTQSSICLAEQHLVEKQAMIPLR